MPVATLDHVIVGVSDLEQGVAAFTAATGVVPVRGGQHPGRGTENALVSLGNGAYLEIIAPQRAAEDNPMVKSLRALERPTAIGWALQVKDAAAAHAYLRDRGFDVTELQPGSRRTTSGDLLEHASSIRHLSGWMHARVIRSARSRGADDLASRRCARRSYSCQPGRTDEHHHQSRVRRATRQLHD